MKIRHYLLMTGVIVANHNCDDFKENVTNVL